MRIHNLESKLEREHLKRVLKAASVSQSRETSFKGLIAEASKQKESDVTSCLGASAADILKWKEDVRTRVNEKNHRVLNDGQFAMASQIVDRVLAEAKELGETGSIKSEPMRWLLHGGPGTGKSHVIKLVHEELFGQILGWNMSVEYQIVALQAVMAEQLHGDTIHHALGIQVFGHKSGSAHKDWQRQDEVAKRVLQWRWLIIDEISMVSARLLGLVDEKLRNVVRDIGANKSKDGHVRPFGERFMRR